MTNSSAWVGAVRTVQYNVFLGTWINYSRGRILGATLTLDRVYGNLLIAFTATFVGIVTAALWRIACLSFHRMYSTSDPRDTLHHQRQAVLRNSPSPASGCWTMFRLVWTWRRSTEGLLVRTLPALIFAGLCFCAFTVAGGFSSSISSNTGNEVLLDGSTCGFVYTGSQNPGTTSSLSNYITQTINNAANYAQECYASNATGIFDCTTFVKDHLPGTVDDQASCPFQGDICRSNDSNIFLDSGYIDSREDFGVNTPDDQRLFFRATLHCAPLNTAGFARNMSTALNNYTEYYYGPTIEPTNFTWQVEDLNGQYLRQLDNKVGTWAANLQMSILNANTANGTVYDEFSVFDPDPRLFRPDADLYLIFLSGNGVYFVDPTDDPWYRGSVPGITIHFSGDDTGHMTAYRPDEAASPMGCIQQYQYCNADHQCGQLASFFDAMATAAPFFNTSLEMIWGSANVSGPVSSRFSWFEQVIYTSYDLNSLLQSLGTASLASRRYFDAGYMFQVPDDQWKVDVTHWWATLMAAKQAAFVNTAQGPSDPAISELATAPENSYMEEMCNNQKILSTGYTSFSLFGLYFTFVTGVLIIIVSYSIEPVFSCLYHRHNYQGYRYLEWTTNETLQLQRLAYQGLGSESWSGYTDAVPKTRPGYILADLPLSYPGTGKVEPGMETKATAETTNSSLTPQSTRIGSGNATGAPGLRACTPTKTTSSDGSEAALPGSSRPASQSGSADPPPLPQPLPPPPPPLSQIKMHTPGPSAQKATIPQTSRQQ